MPWQTIYRQVYPLLPLSSHNIMHYFLLSWKINQIIKFCLLGIPGLCFGTVITAGFAVVLMFNLILWLDLNYLLFKRGKTGVTDQRKKKRLLEDIVEEITDPLWIIIVSCCSWVADMIRCVRK